MLSLFCDPSYVARASVDRYVYNSLAFFEDVSSTLNGNQNRVNITGQKFRGNLHLADFIWTLIETLLHFFGWAYASSQVERGVFIFSARALLPDLRPTSCPQLFSLISNPIRLPNDFGLKSWRHIWGEETKNESKQKIASEEFLASSATMTIRKYRKIASFAFDLLFYYFLLWWLLSQRLFCD